MLMAVLAVWPFFGAPWVPNDTAVSPASNPVPTRIAIYQLTEGESPAVKQGECWVKSITAYRGLRCREGNLIRDPCFAQTTSRVLCPGEGDALCSTPRLCDTVILEVGTLPGDIVMAALPAPWRLELEDGSVCRFSSGGTGTYLGERLNYFCTDGAIVVGFPDAGSLQWTVKKGKFGVSPTKAVYDDGHVVTVGVTAVWY